MIFVLSHTWNSSQCYQGFSWSQAAQASKIWHYRNHSSITAGGIQSGGSQSNTSAGHEQRDKHGSHCARGLGTALCAAGNSVCSSIPAWPDLTLPAPPGVTCWCIPSLSCTRGRHVNIFQNWINPPGTSSKPSRCKTRGRKFPNSNCSSELERSQNIS